MSESQYDSSEMTTQMMVLGTQVSLLGVVLAGFAPGWVGLAVFAFGFLGTIAAFVE